MCKSTLNCIILDSDNFFNQCYYCWYYTDLKVKPRLYMSYHIKIFTTDSPYLSTKIKNKNSTFHSITAMLIFTHRHKIQEINLCFECYATPMSTEYVNIKLFDRCGRTSHDWHSVFMYFIWTVYASKDFVTVLLVFITNIPNKFQKSFIY